MPKLETDLIILGGGIAGLSLAYFYKGQSIVLEKEEQLGGLCRSFALNGVKYDIGPHIIFSKNKAILDWHRNFISVKAHRRSNKIYHQGRFVPYPFENGLYALKPKEIEYCLTTFLNNPYRDLPAATMQQFFLKTFGEGLTKLYLQPYNEKIWKWNPAFLDTQMVSRIPQPPAEDIIAAAKGIKREGYLHQLNFYYPPAGGIENLVQAYADGLKGKGQVINPVKIKKVRKVKQGWEVSTDQGVVHGNKLANCMPLKELVKVMTKIPKEVMLAVQRLRHNSIHIVVVQVKKDRLGKNLAVMFAAPDIIFHRLTKLNYLGGNYRLAGGGSTLLIEVTFRPGLQDMGLVRRETVKRVVDDLVKLRLINRADILDAAIRTFDYAYVIYDLLHRQAVDTILDYLRGQGVCSVGRFAEYAYLNTDQVVEKTQRAAKIIKYGGEYRG